ncbi:MAG TPA: CpsD/CapB family tyrosine-protein kinase, partial [Candidatus Krumholzibacterium sp.]|nr:CpsD/CapB family tyrosine-protein kinase [Candidatus Krumholzibacterium sp.]
MSKIFDALRKAENARRRPQEKGKEAPARRPREKEQVFLKGMDEDFRRSLMNLRNAIDSEMKNRDGRIILFTSAIAGEGKTMISGYLARVLAMGETDRVLLLDCAVNDPRMHELFGINNDRGLLDYLDGTAQLADIVRPIDEGVLDIVTTGVVRSADVAQPLFNSDRMREFMKSAKESYDYVIVDSS